MELRLIDSNKQFFVLKIYMASLSIRPNRAAIDVGRATAALLSDDSVSDPDGNNACLPATVWQISNKNIFVRATR